MTAELKEVLRKTLDNLGQAVFKRFKHYLREQDQIAWGNLEKADTDDTVDLMVQVYSAGAGDVMLTILKKMNHNQLAKDLERHLEECLTGGGVGVNVNATAESGWPWSQQGMEQPGVQRVLSNHKLSMMKQFKYIFVGMEKRENKTLFKQIYTDLYITKGKTEAVNNEHEVWQVEETSRTQTTEEKTIKCNDIFRPLPGQDEDIRTVLMMGIAGIGKTVSVQKFILDWAEGEANQDVVLVVMLPFRELNLLKRKYSLHDLLCVFHRDLKELDTRVYDKYRTVIIFDGLDESRFHLDFNEEIIATVTEASSVDVLITSIIRGKLLFSAFVWITSRPAAVSQIPSVYIDQVTEVRGFTDVQKEEYFRRKIDNEIHADTIVSHIKASRTLHIMCHIPVFCWILATVLQEMLSRKKEKKEMPKTLTEMFIHFLLIQMNTKNLKYHGRNDTDKQSLLESNRDVILKLADLAFKHLQNSSILFYVKDLKEFEIDISDATVNSGMFTGIFKEDSFRLFEEKIYCFVHLTIQEFFAALHVLNSYLNKDTKTLEPFLKCKPRSDQVEPLDELLKNAVNKALESKNGHLDLFVCFLHGISLESNQKLLSGLLTHTHSSPEIVQKTVQTLKVMQRPNISPERCINLFHCLIEIQDYSVHEQIQAYLKAEEGSVKKLSLAHCTALAYVLLMSGEVLDKFDPKKYPSSAEGRRRLIPAVRYCRKALLSDCKLTAKCCDIVASALQAVNSPLTHLDLSGNDLQKSEGKLISALQSANCKLQTLRLVGCGLTDKSGDILAFALQSANSHLRELDLSKNTLGDCGGKLCSEALNPRRKLETLRLVDCGLTEKSGYILSFALQSANSHLKELDLSKNTLSHCGGKLFSEALKLRRKLKMLRLAGCKLTEESCKDVAFAVQYTVWLKELDLSGNNMTITGINLLKEALSLPRCKLQILSLAGCKLSEESCDAVASAVQSWVSLRQLDLSHNNMSVTGIQLLHTLLSQPDCKLTLRYGIGELRKYACELTLDPDTAPKHLCLSERNRKVTHVREQQPHPDHPERFDSWSQVLCREGLSGRCYWEAEWGGGGAGIAVAYECINRKGKSDDCGFGRNDKSWSLDCSGNSYSARHNNKETAIPAPSSSSSRVGVYLDWPAGTLSYYSVSSDTLTHLHTVHSKFNKRLYPGFRVRVDSSVSLCEIT